MCVQETVLKEYVQESVLNECVQESIPNACFQKSVQERALSRERAWIERAEGSGFKGSGIEGANAGTSVPAPPA